MIVVFSTYQSIDVILAAQKKINAQEKGAFVFDLVVCDEAHRTTGVILSDKAEAAFTKIHDNEIVVAKKRLYMTATPRLYTDASKQKAQEGNAVYALWMTLIFMEKKSIVLVLAKLLRKIYYLIIRS